MTDQAPVAQPPPSRGPAPPLPEKPPSVAERTRLLRSSFRKDDIEKPRVPEKPDNRSINSVSSQKSDHKGSNNSVNGERSPSPSQNSSSPTVTSPGSVTSPAGSLPSQKPPVPEKIVPNATVADVNKDVNGRHSPGVGAPVCITLCVEHANSLLFNVYCLFVYCSSCSMMFIGFVLVFMLQ